MNANRPDCYSRFDDDLKACQCCQFRTDCWAERQGRTLDEVEE